MTLAHKSKSKTSKIFKKYGKSINITRNNKTIASFDSLTNSSFRKVNNFKDVEVSPDVTQLILRNLKLAKLSLVKHPCAICGDSSSEIHHIRKVLPVCKHHHNLIHAGKYDGVSLKVMFENFKLEG